jgi:hypothetical protein
MLGTPLELESFSGKVEKVENTCFLSSNSAKIKIKGVLTRVPAFLETRDVTIHLKFCSYLPKFPYL